MSRPFRMMPKYGGEPVPWPPIVTPCLAGQSIMRKLAADHVKVLEKELATGEDGTEKKWGAQQRQHIRREVAKWSLRAEGKDAHYIRHGTHQRPMNAEPPGPADDQVERLRRAAKVRGDYVSNAAHKRKYALSRSEHIKRIVKRWKDNAKGPAGPKQHDPHGE